MSVGKPEVDFPDGEPPTELEITDIWQGDGSVANPGDVVKVHYVGIAFSTGEESDASWDRGGSLQFELGPGWVIAGWDQGVQGMKVGGPPPTDHSPGSSLRGPGRRACDRTGRDPHLCV